MSSPVPTLVSGSSSPALSPLMTPSFSKSETGVQAVLKSSAKSALNASLGVLKKAEKVHSCSEGFEKVVGFLGNCISARDLLRNGATAASTAVFNTLDSIDHTLDVTRFFMSDTHYLFGGGLKNDIENRERLNVAERTAYVVADGASTVSWFSKMGVTLGKIGERVGSSRVFGAVNFAKVGLVSVIIGYGLTVVNSVKKVVDRVNPYENIAIAASKTADFFQKTFMFIGRVNPYTHVALGLFATGVSICVIANEKD